VLDRVSNGCKPELVKAIGAHYHVGNMREIGPRPDIVIECTGAGKLVFEAMEYTSPAGILCLTGLGSGGRKLTIDPTNLNRTLVLENDVMFGSVNSNRRHYVLASSALAKADAAWLARMITRRVPLTQWRDALEKRPDDVKTVLEFKEVG